MKAILRVVILAGLVGAMARSVSAQPVPAGPPVSGIYGPEVAARGERGFMTGGSRRAQLFDDTLTPLGPSFAVDGGHGYNGIASSGSIGAGSDAGFRA